MFQQHRKGRPVPKGCAGSEAGDTFTGQSYGDDQPCPNCGQRHPINETQMVFDVCRVILRALGGSAPAMMIGVLRDNAGNYFAACSPADGTPGQQAFALAIQNNKAFLPPIRILGNLEPAQVESRKGAKLGAQRVRQCTVEGKPIAGRCAAPKLLNHAIAAGLQRPWTMSEIWYDPEENNQNYTHFDTAPSCPTCQNLLPLMLCPHGDPTNLVEFMGVMRKWGM